MPIRGYVGLTGAGKTMLAVRRCRASAERRHAILASNISIVPPEGVDFVKIPFGSDGPDMELLDYLISVRGPAEDRGVEILLDELGIIAPARWWQSFPPDLLLQLSQGRKLRADFTYTSQHEDMVDTLVRRLSERVYKVRSIPGPSIERREAGRRPWLFVVTEWLPGTVDKRDRRVGRSFIRYRREWEAWYDTDEVVRMPGRLRKGAGSSGGRSRSRSSWS